MKPALPARKCVRAAPIIDALGVDDEQMQECAEGCMRCEESCAEMAGE